MSSAVGTGCPSGLAPPAKEPLGTDPTPFVRGQGGVRSLELSISGAKCAGCLSKIEGAVSRLQGVEQARLNLSTGKLSVKWAGALDPRGVMDAVTGLGYGAQPYDPSASILEDDQQGRMLLRSMAVAGFASANIMLLSVAVWANTNGEMGEGTRGLLHLVSALIAIPAVAFAGRPFFQSAWASLKKRSANMDVPISLAVLLALGVSLVESLRGGHEAYFDAAVMLLFFLLGCDVLVRYRPRFGAPTAA